MKNPFGVVDLIESCGAFGTIAAPTGRMERITLDLVYLVGLVVDIGEQTTGRFTIETSRGYEAVVAFYAFRPSFGVQ